MILRTRHRLDLVPSSSSVREQLTDILVRVIGCPAEAVVPEAVLKELGTDSLTIVEVGEELGRRFDVYLSDDTIDSLITVEDAINAVVRHDGSQPPDGAARVPMPLSSAAPPVTEEKRVERRRRIRRFALAFVVAGAAIGAIFGLGGAALVSASGLGGVDLPPLTMPSTAPPTTPAPSAPTATSPTEAPVEPKPTIYVSSSRVSPGERFTLTGAFPALGEGVTLQVQVKDKGSDWDEFPIDTKTRDGGKFKTQLYTSRTGERKFRLLDKSSKKTTPAVTVEIG